MAKNGEFECNASEVFKKFTQLNEKEMKKALKAGVRRGILIIRNDARKIFRSMFPNGVLRNPKYTDTLLEGIRATKVKEDSKHNIVGYAMATSNRKTGSGSYRLVFLEGGTVERYTKKGYYRGRLGAAHFFTGAVIASEGKYEREVVRAIEKTIDKINGANLK